MKKNIIGVDIGGTKIAAGIVSDRGKVISSMVLPTRAKEGFKVSLGQVFGSISGLLAESGLSMKEIDAIGICAPGPLDPIKGIVHNPPNLMGWKNVPLVELIEKKFKKSVKLENDANAAGMAEVIWGAAKGYKHVFYVTVSTGIGTAVIIDGKIYHGKNGMAGECGHATINYDDKKAKCNCGNIGCIETLASGPVRLKQFSDLLKKKPGLKKQFMKDVGKNLERVLMTDIAKAARKGNKLALKTIREHGELLGVWLGSMISILDPEIIVIGGGISLAGEVLFREIRRSIPSHTINLNALKTPVVQAKLKKDVGMFGAAAIVL
ncbi:MAG: ROK family protein [Candidatus Omnitrophica bacterium]|nr:ROK family protein [Candidatus Omnitrophota bacterium]